MLSAAKLHSHDVPGDLKGLSICFSPAVKGVRPACWIGVPARPAGSVPLVVVHGIQRDARGTFELFSGYAASTGRVLIAPLFDEAGWKGYQRVLGARRADLGLLEILGALRSEGVLTERRIELFGYSAGAQFAHRFALMHPQWVDSATICAAGWYLFPDMMPYPRGLGVPERPMSGYTGFIAANLPDFLRLPIRVVVGDQDDAIDEFTRSNEALDLQQGRTRLERARNWVTALGGAAARVGVPSAAVLEILPDCGHDLRQCLQSGAMPDFIPDVAPGMDAGRQADTVVSIVRGGQYE